MSNSSQDAETPPAVDEPDTQDDSEGTHQRGDVESKEAEEVDVVKKEVDTLSGVKDLSTTAAKDESTPEEVAKASDVPVADLTAAPLTTPTKAPPQSVSTSTPAVAAADSQRKVKVHFVAVGSAPILKKTKFKIDASQNFAYLTANLRRTLKLADTKEELFLYLKSSFCPSPDDTLGNLEDCFNVRDELIVQYSIKEAWG